MNLKSKMTMGSIALSVVPLILAGILINWIVAERAEDALRTQATERLIATRDMKKAQIEDYFGMIENQVAALSKNPMVISAVEEFEEAFAQYLRQVPGVDVGRKRKLLSEYYQYEFEKEYRRRNHNTSIQVSGILDELSETTVALQYAYIRENEYPLGKKDEMVRVEDGSDYSRYHAKYHPVLRDFLQRFGYYDIFLVDSRSGHVLYSVYKELDFGTSLLKGPYAASGIGEAFRAANRAETGGDVVLTDFSPYTPSYEDPAAFIASPIFSGNEKIGVLIFQMPVDRINAVMTSDRRWEEVGLGQTGETYIVGSDGTMRSLSRFLIEDKSGYLEAVGTAGTPGDVVDLIDKKDTSVGLQTIESDGVHAALAGMTATDTYLDYRGAPVMGAYAPLDVRGQHWAIVSEIDVEEALSAMMKLERTIVTWIVSIILLVTLISSLVGWRFSGTTARPILELSSALSRVEQDADLTVTIESERSDELGYMTQALSSMLATFRSLIGQISSSSTQLASASEELSAVTEETGQAVGEQCSRTEQVASAVHEMAASIQEVARNAAAAAEAAHEANVEAKIGSDIIGRTIKGIGALAADVERSGQLIVQLESDITDVGAVLEVIQGVAAQTNLLALNAAIEAARAGEHGRGFSVVADEVRNLAQRTHDSTEEIQQVIERLQLGARTAVEAMRQGHERAQAGAKEAQDATTSLAAITGSIRTINEMNVQIASAAEEQSAVADDINDNVSGIQTIADCTGNGARQIADASIELSSLAVRLQALVAEFKVA